MRRVHVIQLVRVVAVVDPPWHRFVDLYPKSFPPPRASQLLHHVLPLRSHLKRPGESPPSTSRLIVAPSIFVQEAVLERFHHLTSAFQTRQLPKLELRRQEMAPKVGEAALECR